jgi:hypothetical protein
MCRCGVIPVRANEQRRRYKEEVHSVGWPLARETTSMMRLSKVVVAAGHVMAQDIDYTQFVNPFIGSEGAIPGYACK